MNESARQVRGYQISLGTSISKFLSPVERGGPFAPGNGHLVIPPYIYTPSQVQVVDIFLLLSSIWPCLIKSDCHTYVFYWSISPDAFSHVGLVSSLGFYRKSPYLQYPPQLSGRPRGSQWRSEISKRHPVHSCIYQRCICPISPSPSR